ncbi:angiotensin-converting enzyme-like [Episyrphus balteatus]|uniref:angiotensin-converting enzyme-like n=1 Tax=Episyrphus balteatus TaxID=286459 RepID=UPI0024858013|nr:angiotensin-converting enzyme-like [Episyrphus balteatus]
MFTFFNNLTDKKFNFDVNSQRNQYKLNRNYVNFVNKIVTNAKKFDFNNFKDKELKYAFEVLVQLADENIIGASRNSRLLESLRELDYLPSYKEIPEYDDDRVKLSFKSHVEEIMKKTTDEEELKHYWIEWRNVTGNWAEDNLMITIDAIRDAAALSGLSPVEFWSRGFNITDMEHLMWKTRSLYWQLHAFFRNLLQKKFGKSIIGPSRLIPDHLFRQIGHQIMTNYSIIEELFPYNSLPHIDVDAHYSSTLYEIADLFYQNLGFEKYPSNIWEDRIKIFQPNKSVENEEEDEDKDKTDDDYSFVHYDYDEDREIDKVDNCEVRTIYKTPNISLQYCDNMDFLDFLEAHAEMGKLYYAKEMKGLPAYFFGAPQNLDYAIGKTAMLTASTYDYVEKIDTRLIGFYDITSKIEMNRVFRMAVQRFLYLPLDFVHAQVMIDLLSETITFEELNDHYWYNMMTYAGIKAPEGHTTDTYDFPFNFYQEMNNNQMSIEFTTEILSFQIHKKLCELSGKFPKKALHFCSIYGNGNRTRDAGNALKKMMKFGKSKPFNEVLASMFPEDPKVTADGILEFFKPLNKMLVRRNKKANINVLGWDLTLID